MSSEAPLLSVCMIVKNEESNIPALLDSLSSLSCELIVVDTGSSDRTVELCKTGGAKVVEWEWCDDFAAARNVSLHHATGCWIIWLDADDRLSPTAADRITELSQGIPTKGYQFLIKNARDDESIGSRHPQLRMFPNDSRLRFKGRVHEQIAPALATCSYPIEATSIEILHTGYADPDLLKKKTARNMNLLELLHAEAALDELGFYYLGTDTLKLGDYERARDLFLECLKLLEDRSDQILRTVVPGQLAGVIEHLQGADLALETLLLHAPKDLVDWHSLQLLTAGELKVKLGEDDAALNLYEKAFDPVFSRPSRLEINSGKICKKVLAWLVRYWKTRNMSLAVALLRLLKNAMKDVEMPRSILPDLYFEHGLYGQAAELYRWCVAVDPDDVGAWAGLVTTLRLQGDPAAEEFLEVALQRFPQHALVDSAAPEDAAGSHCLDK